MNYTDPSGLLAAPADHTWDDFKGDPDPKSKFDAQTFWEREWTYDNSLDGTVANKCGVWTATITDTPKNTKFSAVFNPSKSWVKKGKGDPALLKHENLRLKIADYVAQKALANLPKMVGKGEATNANKKTAIDEAIKKATDDLAAQFEAYGKKWAAMDDAASAAYDMATNHGANAETQSDWESHLQKFVDGALKDN